MEACHQYPPVPVASLSDIIMTLLNDILISIEQGNMEGAGIWQFGGGARLPYKWFSCG